MSKFSQITREELSSIKIAGFEVSDYQTIRTQGQFLSQDDIDLLLIEQINASKSKIEQQIGALETISTQDRITPTFSVKLGDDIFFNNLQ